MGEGESSSVGGRSQPLWKMLATGLAVPSPVGREGQGEGCFVRYTPSCPALVFAQAQSAVAAALCRRSPRRYRVGQTSRPRERDWSASRAPLIIQASRLVFIGITVASG